MRRNRGNERWNFFDISKGGEKIHGAILENLSGMVSNYHQKVQIDYPMMSVFSLYVILQYKCRCKFIRLMSIFRIAVVLHGWKLWLKRERNGKSPSTFHFSPVRSQPVSSMFDLPLPSELTYSYITSLAVWNACIRCAYTRTWPANSELTLTMH